LMKIRKSVLMKFIRCDDHGSDASGKGRVGHLST